MLRTHFHQCNAFTNQCYGHTFINEIHLEINATDTPSSMKYIKKSMLYGRTFIKVMHLQIKKRKIKEQMKIPWRNISNFLKFHLQAKFIAKTLWNYKNFRFL